MPLPLPLTDFVDRVHRFDDRVDSAVDRVRGNKVLDRTFYGASELADFSLLWHLVGTARGVTSDRRADEHARVIDEIRSAALAHGLETLGLVESPLLGAKGNKEFFIHLRKVER